MAIDAATAERIDLIAPTENPAEDGVLFRNGGLAYDRWVRSTGVPIYRGYYIEDLRTLELGWWEERSYNAAFIQLFGQEGVSESRVTEIPPGGALPATRLGVDELVYVLSGSGTTSIEGPDDSKRSIEWRKRSLFMLHHGQQYRHFNATNDEPVRLLQYNYLPIAMSAVPDYQMLLNYEPPRVAQEKVEVVEARLARASNAPAMTEGVFWYGDFFPDMAAWEGLEDQSVRGPGSRVVFFGFPGSEMMSHMAVFPTRTYKRAHRHGPGRSIVIPAGEGYSILWKEGEEKIIVPWHEGTVLTPPDRWFHQHFNVGKESGRYLALHPLKQFAGNSERVEDRARDEVDYPNEDPWIREKFESELAERGLTSLMPEQAYTEPYFRLRA